MSDFWNVAPKAQFVLKAQSSQTYYICCTVVIVGHGCINIHNINNHLYQCAVTVTELTSMHQYFHQYSD